MSEEKEETLFYVLPIYDEPEKWRDVPESPDASSQPEHHARSQLGEMCSPPEQPLGSPILLYLPKFPIALLQLL